MNDMGTVAMRRYSKWLHRGPFSSDEEMWNDFNRNHTEEQKNMFYNTWVYNLADELWEENKKLKAQLETTKEMEK
jgi:hypothetical protein